MTYLTRFTSSPSRPHPSSEINSLICCLTSCSLQKVLYSGIRLELPYLNLPSVLTLFQNILSPYHTWYLEGAKLSVQWSVPILFIIHLCLLTNKSGQRQHCKVSPMPTICTRVVAGEKRVLYSFHTLYSIYPFPMSMDGWWCCQDVGKCRQDKGAWK